MYQDFVGKYALSTSQIIHDRLDVYILGTDVVCLLIAVINILLFVSKNITFPILSIFGNIYLTWLCT